MPVPRWRLLLERPVQRPKRLHTLRCCVLWWTKTGLSIYLHQREQPTYCPQRPKERASTPSSGTRRGRRINYLRNGPLVLDHVFRLGAQRVVALGRHVRYLARTPREGGKGNGEKTSVGGLREKVTKPNPGGGDETRNNLNRANRVALEKPS